MGFFRKKISRVLLVLILLWASAAWAMGPFGIRLPLADYMHGNGSSQKAQPVFDINTRLIKASSEGRLNLVRRLIQNGAGVNARNSKGDTALMAASYNGYAEIVRLLAENGADINAVSNSG